MIQVFLLHLVLRSDIINLLFMAGLMPRGLPVGIKQREVMRMTNLELFMALITVAGLVLTIYFGMKR